MVVAVAPIEREHPDRPGRRWCRRRAASRAGGRRTSGRRRRPRPGWARSGGHLLERQRPGRIGGRRHDDSRGWRREPAAAASGRRTARSARARYVNVTVAPGATVPMLQARPGQALGERALAGRRPAACRPPSSCRHVAQRRRWRVVDDDLVGRLVAAVGDSQRDGDRIAGRDRARGADALLEPEPRPSGEVSTRCMSMASGATAREVSVAPEPSMKKRTPANSPTPRTTPASAARVRRGLRTRSRHT